MFQARARSKQDRVRALPGERPSSSRGSGCRTSWSARREPDHTYQQGDKKKTHTRKILRTSTQQILLADHLATKADFHRRCPTFRSTLGTMHNGNLFLSGSPACPIIIECLLIVCECVTGSIGGVDVAEIQGQPTTAFALQGAYHGTALSN